MTTELPTEKELWAAMPKSVFWKTQPTGNFVGTMNDIPTHENAYCYPMPEMRQWTERYRRLVKNEMDRTIQTYEGMIEVRELVIANHLKRLKSIYEVAPYILSVFDALQSEGTQPHSDVEIEEKAIKALKWFTEIEKEGRQS